jgi:integrase
MKLPYTGSPVYDNHLRKWNQFHKGRRIRRADITAFFTTLRPVYKPATLGSIRSSLRAGLRLAGIDNIQELFSDLRIQNRRTRLNTSNLLSEDEVRTFIRNAPPRVSTLARFLYATGVRISGALDVRVTDCYLRNGMVRIPISSKGHEYETTISPEFFDEIKIVFASAEFLFQSPHERYSRQNWFAQVRRYGKEILGRGNLSPHKLKHSMVSHLLMRGKTVSQVAERTGNTPAVISQYYDLNVLDDTDLRNLEQIAG